MAGFYSGAAGLSRRYRGRLSHRRSQPHDLALLERQLKEICRNRDLSADGPEAGTIARELVDWYLFGIKDPVQLTAMLEPLLEE